MARQRKKTRRAVSGWIILDKPKGMGSTEAVSKIKWLFHADKAGHAGTLDPLASGMLPIALGEATKTVPYVMDGSKVYRFTVCWGAERSSDDLEGEITKTSDNRPTRAQIEALLPQFTGTIMQIPPMFSAIKIAGERAYDLAREGEHVDIPARQVEIYALDLVDMPDENTSVFEVECGKGTYVRALARDMGRQLECYGYIGDLRRLEVLPFTEEDLVSLDELEQAAPPPLPKEPSEDPMPPRDFSEIDSYLIETGAALEGLPSYTLNDEQARRVMQGNPVILRGRDAPSFADEICVLDQGRVLAIGKVEKGQFQPKRVFKS